MKIFQYKTPYICWNFLSALFLFLLVFGMQNVSAAGSLSSFNYPGNETDRLALLAIKSQLIDGSKGFLSSWNNSVHHCQWDGITCGRNHNRVTVLDMHSQDVSGTISPFIGNLSFLKFVVLANNSLYGPIPNSLGDLFRLQELFLLNNTLTGEIPGNLSSCINLRILNIGNNQITGTLPAGLGALSKLEQLHVNVNNLTGPLFDVIQNLTSLERIFTSYNSFTGTIPNNIGRMQNLIKLGLVKNELSGTLPASLFNLPFLQVLDLGGNQLHGELPTHMTSNSSNLIWLNLAQNNFLGSIPTITNLTNLEIIVFSMNSFSGRVSFDFSQFHSLFFLNVASNYLEGDINFISTLVNCSQLTSLELSQNEFSGTIPISIGNLSTSLSALSIGEGLISGTIPAGLTNLINLRLLYIGNSKITSSIPHDIGKLYRMENLDLRSNRLTGNIPNSLGNLSYLSTLYFPDNRLEGSIPLSIGNCPSLLYLNLNSNELNGTLENKLFNASATFVNLQLSDNNFEGPLPLEIGKQTSLVRLTLAMNKFTEVLPDRLSECTELQYLYMQDNSFHGDIPSSYASLTSLQKIDLSQNNLSGQIPAFLSNISSINYLDLSHNDFEGRVPTSSVFANARAVSIVGNSRLCGGIPELHLPKCIEHEIIIRKKRTVSHSLRLVIPIIGAFVGLLVIVTGIYVACIRKKKIPPIQSDSAMGEAFMKVSYSMLLKATNGFSAKTLLGSGTFGSVYKAILDGKTVAVKVLNLQHCDATKSFTAECKVLRNVRHRNLVGIITACSSTDFHGNDFRALVYEFMPNGSLDKWLHEADGNMTLPHRIGVAIDVAHALNYLHHECETPIVHCDLKPSNILINNDMVAHVGDFGIARFLTQPRHPNQSSTIGIMGTIGYTAPEYGLGSETSTAGDVYSYGILLLELMTGKSPTDNMFKEDYDLHRYAQEVLPDQVLQIIDPALEEDYLSEEAEDRRAIQGAIERKVECIVSVLNVGVLCSNHLPQDRMKIPDAISKLQAARDNLLSTSNRRNIPARGE